jgi:small GTP-binding protein
MVIPGSRGHIFLNFMGEKMTIKKKIVMLGDSAVGKTSMVRRYVYDTFEDSYITTIGSKLTTKELVMEIEGEEIELKLVIWDVLGRVGYNASHAKMFAGADGAFLIADLTRKGTLGSLERYWIPLLFEVVGNVPLVFGSNKSDLENEIAFDTAMRDEMASRYNYGIAESLPSHLSTTYLTSAKSGENIENAFESIAHLLLTNKTPENPIKELYETLVAEGIYRQTDKRTLIGATDALIVDFSGGFEDDNLAQLHVSSEFIRAGLDVRNPTKEALLRVVEFLAETESEYKDEEVVINNRNRRLDLVNRINE